MLVLVDPRTQLAVQPGDISSMRMALDPNYRNVLVLHMTSGQEIRIPSSNDNGQVDLKAIHANLMAASK
jgi:hypothetical protein